MGVTQKDILEAIEQQDEPWLTSKQILELLQCENLKNIQTKLKQLTKYDYLKRKKNINSQTGNQYIYKIK